MAERRGRRLTVPGSEKLDFRDIDAVDDKTAYVLSIGPGELSRIYKTSDAGLTWTEQFVNRDPKAFFDAMAFWDANRGVAVSDAVDGQFVILTTSDGGKSWVRVAAGGTPAGAPERRFLRGERHERGRRRAESRLDRHRRRERSARPPVERWRPHVGTVADTARRRPVRRHLLDRLQRRDPRHRGRRRLQGRIRREQQRRAHHRRRRHVDADERSVRLSLRRRYTFQATGRRSWPSAPPAATCRPIAERHGRRFPGRGFTRSALPEAGQWGLGWGKRAAPRSWRETDPSGSFHVCTGAGQELFTAEHAESAEKNQLTLRSLRGLSAVKGF